MEPKFKQGEIVYERVRPAQKLVVRSHMGQIYYCKAEEHPNSKELVYFERELMSKVQSGLGDSYL